MCTRMVFHCRRGYSFSPQCDRQLADTTTCASSDLARGVVMHWLKVLPELHLHETITQREQGLSFAVGIVPACLRSPQLLTRLE